jgi:hypothetical protein
VPVRNVPSILPERRGPVNAAREDRAAPSYTGTWTAQLTVLLVRPPLLKRQAM